ncbi:MAG: malto-oligosyltrehalose synthase [Acidiferrobacterales bacterium]
MPRIPVATYRLQLNRDFTFAQAAQQVPYLRELGISHCYVSPILRARTGSNHGYDVVDHNDLNPEIGTREDFERFVAVLREHDMGLILDIVPNHMGVGGADNLWWLDVLENGEASEFAAFFDIDWHPAKSELRGKLLLPFLEDHYGTVLEKRLLTLHFDREQGRFGIAYHEHYFPVDPKTYPFVLRNVLDHLPEGFAGRETLQALTAAFDELPSQRETEAARSRIRSQAIAAGKYALAQMCRDHPQIAGRIAGAVSELNGDPPQPDSLDALHQLLEQQAYRLAYWLVAADEINYRRFFDINSLAGLRMERPEVFQATHRVVVELARAGKLQGFRVDHPDGLFDPARYFRMLRDAILPEGGDEGPAVYTVAEKILASGEQLRSGWPVHGTTGYEFGAQLNGLFVYPDAGPLLTEIYQRFTGRADDFTDLLCASKKLVMRTLMSGELMVLANLLDQISESDRHTRDYTLHALRDALMEVIACFPVYRTYISDAGVSEEDRRCIEQAVVQAMRRSPAADVSVFGFLRRILLLEHAGPDPDNAQLRFVMKFQQYTAPVMAKGMEDTGFYAYSRFIALNEVGDDPRRFGFTMASFHQANRERQSQWPHTLLSTSTHDSKRSEDVRARLDVLSEMPATWRTHVSRWSRLNASARRVYNDFLVPAREGEYLLYQTLVGAWPMEVSGTPAFSEFAERIERYMLKAVREAKVHTSWINPDVAYEEAVLGFVRALLDPARKSAFRADIAQFSRHVALFGMLNGLSHVLVGLTAPGVPDIYQGNEIWQLSLVDPDNRGLVDYERRRRILDQLRPLMTASGSVLAARVRLLLNTWEDGRVKMYVLRRTLELRARHPDVFQGGEYLALSPRGARTQHICAFARRGEAVTTVTVAPRWFARLTGERERLPLGAEIWGDTDIEAPAPGDYLNVFTGETFAAEWRRGAWWLRAARMFARFPVALLLWTPPGDPGTRPAGLIDVAE